VIPLYFGFDPREEFGSHVFCSSVIHRAKRPVSLIPLHLDMFTAFYGAGQRDGTNNFIYTRFLIPFLQNFQGWAIFADGADMVCQGDISELWAMRDPMKAVMVVKHDYKTKHARKYVGTGMEAPNEDYPRKNWSSLMLINCNHWEWLDMTPERVAELPGSVLHRFSFMAEDSIGELPKEWNWIADEYGENQQAKMLHWTAGVPGFSAYANAPMADVWAKEAARAQHVIK
jgi:lipopolysaccharide biosynthesis glycosyltransferase